MASRPGPRLLFVSALCALLFTAGLARNGPPSPAPANAPPELFSASRARNLLRSVLEPETPHPEGSAENALVESRIVAALAGMGYSPSIQEEFVCGSYGTCGTVRNVLARRPGREERGAVLLSAHYDSVEAGPGASDDGLGVASALEIARILRSAPPRTRPVVFLLDDGEEQGLLGAEAFATKHPWARDISAVVNLEARGTSGASLLFETSHDNRGLIRAAGAIPHPVTTSVYPTIYRMLPNDTDLTVFMRHGMAGVNFGCIGDVAHYHTPTDDLAHLSLSTLQHEGDNALAMVESLASSGNRPDDSSDEVFFDVFGAKIAGWPEPWTVPLAAATVLLLSLGLLAFFRKTRVGAGAGLLGLVSFAAMLAVPAFLSLGACSVLRKAGILPSSWTAHPVLPLAGLWLLSLAAAGTVLHLSARRLSAAALSVGVWTGWALLAVAAAVALPGVSFLLLLPLFAAALPFGIDPESRSALAAPPVAAFVWLPLAWRLWDAVGWNSMAMIAPLVALAATPLAPFAARLASPARKRLLLALAAGAAALLLASIGLAPWSPDSPRRLTIFRHEDADSGRARWILDGESVPKEMVSAGGFSPAFPFPWSSFRALIAPAPGGGAPPPEFRLEEKSEAGGRVRFRGRIVSPRGAPFARMWFPPTVGVERISMGGVTVPPLLARALPRNGWRSYSCVTLPAGGIEIEGELTGPSPFFVLMDRAAGIPPSGAALRAARPADSVPSQTGDASLVTRRIRL